MSIYHLSKHRLSFLAGFLGTVAFAALVAWLSMASNLPLAEKAAEASENKSADDAPPATDRPAPLRVLLVTGGCCHDFETQKLILSEGIAARCNAEFTIVHIAGDKRDIKFPLFEKDDWDEGFDVVLHNQCVGEVDDADYIERILKPHREGLPAVVLHCTMHSYRKKNPERWHAFTGVKSMAHDAKYAFEVKNLAPEHPIMQGFGESWQTPNGELYFIDGLGENTTPLAEAMSRKREAMQTCVWTNEYGQGRVFGTTVGHHNETMRDPVYLDLVTRGLLWAVGKLDEEGKPLPGYGPRVSAEK